MSVKERMAHADFGKASGLHAFVFFPGNLKKAANLADYLHHKLLILLLL